MGLCLVAGCARIGAPRDFLDKPGDAGVSPRGGWLVLELSEDDREPITGEFLGQDAERLYLVAKPGFGAVSDDSFLAVDKDSVKVASAWGYDPDYDELSFWSALGIASTLSHGIVLILSTPVWVVSGISFTAAQSRISRIRWPDRHWSDLDLYARYPQGLPPGVDRRRFQSPGKPQASK
jgi:hypothetical protein